MHAVGSRGRIVPRLHYPKMIEMSHASCTSFQTDFGWWNSWLEGSDEWSYGNLKSQPSRGALCIYHQATPHFCQSCYSLMGFCVCDKSQVCMCSISWLYLWFPRFPPLIAIQFDLRLKFNLGTQLGGYGPWWQSTVFSCLDEEFIGCSRFFVLIVSFHTSKWSPLFFSNE